MKDSTPIDWEDIIARPNESKAPPYGFLTELNDAITNAKLGGTTITNSSAIKTNIEKIISDYNKYENNLLFMKIYASSRSTRVKVLKGLLKDHDGTIFNNDQLFNAVKGHLPQNQYRMFERLNQEIQKWEVNEDYFPLTDAKQKITDSERDAALKRESQQTPSPKNNDNNDDPWGWNGGAPGYRVKTGKKSRRKRKRPRQKRRNTKQRRNKRKTKTRSRR